MNCWEKWIDFIKFLKAATHDVDSIARSKYSHLSSANRENVAQNGKTKDLYIHSIGQVLVTGASGFVGRNVVSQLHQHNLNPIAWMRRFPADGAGLFPTDVDVRSGNLEDAAEHVRLNQNITAVIHLAAVVAPYQRAETFRVNVDQTRELVRACSRRTTPPVFIYVSSLSAGGPSRDGYLRREADRPEPRSIYGESKLAAESALAEFSCGVPISIVRPPGVFGPWDRNLLQMFQTVKKGWNLIGISKHFQYSFVHVEDLAEGIIRVMDRGVRMSNAFSSGEGEPTSLTVATVAESATVDASGIYNIADPRPLTFIELANFVADSLGCAKPRHVTIPAWLTWPLAFAADRYGQWFNKRMYLNIDKVREATAGSWTCDTAKATRELDFTVRHNLQQRVAQTAEWYRRQGWI